MGNALEATTTSALSNNGIERDRTNTVIGQYTNELRSNLLLEVCSQYSREQWPRDTNALEPTVQTAVGNYRTVNFLGQNLTTDWRAQTAGNATWLKGGHTLKFGATR